MDWLTFWDHVVQHVAWPLVVVVAVISQHKAFGGLIKGIENLKLKWGDKEASVGIQKSVDKSTELVAAATAVQLAPAEATIALTIPAFTTRVEAQVEDAKPAVTEHAGAVDQLGTEVIKPDPVLTKAIQDLDAAFNMRGGVGKSSSLIKAIAISEASPKLAINSAWSSVRAALQKVVVAWPAYPKQKFTVFDIDDDTLIGFAGQLGKFHATLKLSIEQLQKIYGDVSSTESSFLGSAAARQYVENAAQVVDLIEIAAAEAKAAK